MSASTGQAKHADRREQTIGIVSKESTVELISLARMDRPRDAFVFTVKPESIGSLRSSNTY
jgi:hypothetical protein